MQERADLNRKLTQDTVRHLTGSSSLLAGRLKLEFDPVAENRHVPRLDPLSYGSLLAAD